MATFPKFNPGGLTMKRRYPSSQPPRHRRPPRRLCISNHRRLSDEERETLEDLHAATGHIFGRHPHLRFHEEFNRWMDQHPDHFILYLKRYHARLWSRARKQGIENPEDLPETLREFVHQSALTLAGHLFRHCADLLHARMHLKQDPESLPLLDQAASDVDQIVEYLLDLREPERSHWLALIEPLRAGCHRQAANLRRQSR